MARVVLFFIVKRGFTTTQQIPGAEGSHIKLKFNALFKAFIKRSKQLLFFSDPQDKPLLAPVHTRARNLLILDRGLADKINFIENCMKIRSS